MSTAVLEQVAQLTRTLSPVEKVQLIEWLGAAVVQELTNSPADQPVNGHGLVVDTTVLIHLLRGDAIAAQWLATQPYGFFAARPAKRARYSP